MRHKIGRATSQQEINLWRKAARACDMPIQVEIWENLKPQRMRALITIFDLDFSDIWVEYDKTLLKRYGHKIHITDLIDHKIEDIQKKFQTLFAKTSKGSREKKAKEEADEKRAHDSMMLWLAKPSTRNIFIKAMKESSLFTTRLPKIPPSNKISFPPIKQTGVIL